MGMERSGRTRLARTAAAVVLFASGLGLGLSRAALGSRTGVGATGTVTTTTAGGIAKPCREMHLYAEVIKQGSIPETRLGFGLTPDTATIPGPLIVLNEGECMRIQLTNDIPGRLLKKERAFYGQTDLPLGVSIHPHGVKYQQDSDGTAMTNSITPPGTSRVYTWYASANTAGYWWYHDHNVGTDHGTGGLAAGMWGGLIVRRAGDPVPDVPTFVVAFGDNATIDLQHFPDTPVFTAVQGQRVEFLVFAWGNDFHTFHLHAHSWADNRTGIFDPNDPNVRTLDAVPVTPSFSFGFQVIAGDVSGPGDWMYHCHVQAHSDAGMWSIFRVLPPGSPESEVGTSTARELGLMGVTPA